MRHDVPAALPLIALIAGLAGMWPAAALALALLFRRRGITVIVFYALGVWLAHRVATRPLPTLDDEERFVTIEAPLQRDWAARDRSFVLRADRFCIGDVTYKEPLSIYVRFTPPLMEMEATIRAEGFLRRTEHGDYALTVKSQELLCYGGELHGPAAWNHALANRLRPHVAQHPVEVALIEALILGRGELLTGEVRDSFKRGGTYHLLVFSGLQIALAAAALAALLRWLHRPRASDWLLLAFAVIAPLFIGPTASVSRAATGIGLYALARILKRPTSVENLWCVAALLRLIIEPRDLTDASFHLTYAGAGALIFLARNRRWLLRALAAELTITPLTLFHFHQYALGGSLLTIALAPVMLAMLVVSALACAFPRDALFSAIAALHRLCGFMNGFAFSGAFTAPPLWAMVAGYGLALFALTLERRGP
ncbi:MAG TPA: ComEC/Rec2 family competence protein, partial [Thermoanaerobaculia bacterium]|nr:ComEC/Rec2 family competence protein [Thermoanaerobaculia bacterium]